ncbi:hypothetical protein HELRODRAFT_184291, partial [Helobdella robusta]|uniref:G-protein coupled receptors family 1 profile domain-containing protein n=1 Tax=Helobdella robusta TaxID=6412 RepID=T1FKX3_HELRO
TKINNNFTPKTLNTNNDVTAINVNNNNINKDHEISRENGFVLAKNSANILTQNVTPYYRATFLAAIVINSSRSSNNNHNHSSNTNTTASHKSNDTTSQTEAPPLITAPVLRPEIYILFTTIGVLGSVSNLFVISVIIAYKPMRKQISSYYIFAQSFTDAAVALSLLVTTVHMDGGTWTYVKGNIWDEIVCRLWLTRMPLWASLVSSAYIVIAITIERL